MGAADRGFLRTRVHQREWMDAPDITDSDFEGALAGLRRVNRFTRGPGIIWSYLYRWAAGSDEPFRVLDVGCGGGDTAIALTRRFNRLGVEARVDGCDISKTAVTYAKARAEEAGVACAFVQLDATADTIPRTYDVVMSSLFLHHLQHDQAVKFLRRSADAARRGVLVHDLVRSRAGWWLAYAGVRLLLCNAVCREDGPRSVESAFTPDEALELASEAGLNAAVVQKHFPFRFVLCWEKHP